MKKGRRVREVAEYWLSVKESKGYSFQPLGGVTSTVGSGETVLAFLLIYFHFY